MNNIKKIITFLLTCCFLTTLCALSSCSVNDNISTNGSSLNRYKATFLNYDGSLVWESYFSQGERVVYGGRIPLKESDEKVEKYIFSGWDKPLGLIYQDTTFVAQYDEIVRKFTVTYLNYNSDVLFIDQVNYGEDSVYVGELPFREEDERVEKYTFVSWDQDTTNVTSNLVVKPIFNELLKEYIVTFVNYDDTKLYEKTVHYGDCVEYRGILPTKISDDNNVTYVFIGWDKSLDYVRSDLIVKAQFIELPVNEENESINLSHWIGKTMTVMGDSISNGYVNSSLQLEQENRYYGIAAKEHNMKLGTCSTLNGTTISSIGNISNPFVNRVNSLDESADLIIITGGTNDYAFGTPLGTLQDKTDISFYGALYVLCEELAKKYSDKTIVFITPINRRNANGVDATYEPYSSSLTHTLQDYRDAILKRAGNEFGFIVIDGSQLGLNAINQETFNAYYSDVVHINEAGHQLIGNALAKLLYSI